MIGSLLLIALLHLTILVYSSLPLKLQESVWTDGQGLSIARNVGLKFKLSEIVVDTFHPKFLPIVRTMKQYIRE